MSSFTWSFQKVAMIAAIPVALGAAALPLPAMAQSGGQVVAATDANAAAAVAIVNAAGKAKKDGGSVSGAIADLLAADAKAPGMDLKQIMSVVRGDATISPAELDKAIAEAKAKLAGDKGASDALDAASKVQAADNKKVDCIAGSPGCVNGGVQTSSTGGEGGSGGAGVQTGATGGGATGATGATGGGGGGGGALPGGNTPTSYQASVVPNSATTSHNSASRGSVGKSVR